MKQNFRPIFAALLVAAVMIAAPAQNGYSRPSKSKAGAVSIQTFKRQKNTLSNLDFYFTNKGVLFNNDNIAGLNWPRGTSNSYIFGGGLWFATKKYIGGIKRKLVELGYNPNSGSGWYTEGQINDPDQGTNHDSKYISYLSPRYNGLGVYTAGANSTVPDASMDWPIWDTSTTKSLKHNYYFGDFIASNDVRKSLVGKNRPNGVPYAPAMLSQEDIVNMYTDSNAVNANPEYKQGSGYPFGLNILEVIYSWSFGRYRDMIFIRHKVTNASKDTLFECFDSPAFDPDLGVGAAAAGNDYNSYFGLTHQDTLDAHTAFPPSSPYYQDPTKLNMGYQWSGPESGKQYGMIGFAFLESPATQGGIVLDNSDSATVQGYGPNGIQQLGLTTFKQWTIANDPPTPDLRYDFISDGTKDHDVTIQGDMRLLCSTGPFTMPPGKSVETVVGIGIALASTTNLPTTKDSLLKLMAFAHTVFADTSGSYKSTGDSTATVVKHFITPVPPDIPSMTTTSLDRAILVQWDNVAELSKDPLSTTLPFNTYDLYRTTRSDHDSTIRPDGTSPTVHLGSWSLWSLKADSIVTNDTLHLKTKAGKDTTLYLRFVHYYTKRTNKTANVLPHSFLDIGDDNNDGVINGSEGLLNGVRYYYILTATDEYDSINNVGPLTTAVIQSKNFVVGIPSRPVFPDLPNKVAGDISCISGAASGPNIPLAVAGIDSVSLEIVDTGKFVDLYSNDTVCVSFLPRWTENNDLFLRTSALNIYMNVTDTRQGKQLTFDKLYNPNASPSITPWNFASGIIERVKGQHADSNFSGAFTSDNALFAPYQTIDQAFRVLVNYQFQQDTAPYKIHSVQFGSNAGDQSIVRLSHRTLVAPAAGDPGYDLSNLPNQATNPSFLGAIGECSYEISFGSPTSLSEQEADTLGNIYTITTIKDPNSATEFTPQVLPIIVKSLTHCGAFLKPIRAGNRNDINVEFDYHYYINRVLSTLGTPIAAYNDPDTMLVPQPGKYAVDAYHFAQTGTDPSTANFILKTTGSFYYPFSLNNNSHGQTLATVHRVRLAGAEVILNYPGISSPITGDTTVTGPANKDFQPGDKIVVNFTGMCRGLPMPDSCFVIYTSGNKKLDFTSDDLYKEQKILDQVQVVPNPYIVTHLGQTSTDAAKLFFTRLPPRATIEIYTLAGDLVNTIEHRGSSIVNGADSLHDRYNVEEWNLLTSGRQRVGSQVLVARIIAKDPTNDAILGETTKKFAVILGGYRQVVGQ
ncbi:MAG TPA: hypothetical protein VEW28_09190 [Candidatus Kapabacteria bacterium]|nr:hypothetical protein [Candidatus Kapabacteria bacterium]